MKRLVTQIAYTPTQNLSKLSLLQRSLLPLLSLASSLYKPILSLRHYLYHCNFFKTHRLPVPVISVGNLSWGGNGKTPMVEFLARWLHDAGVVPLVLTRISDKELKHIEFTVRGVKDDIPIFFTRLSSSCFFEVNNCNSKMDLNVLHNSVVLCVSGIGSSDAFVRGIEKLRPLYVDRLDFSDHHLFQGKDIEMIEERLRKLHDGFGVRPVVVVTEKDYDRDPVILKELYPFEVLVLSSHLQIMPSMSSTEEHFKNLLKQLLQSKSSSR